MMILPKLAIPLGLSALVGCACCRSSTDSTSAPHQDDASARPAAPFSPTPISPTTQQQAVAKHDPPFLVHEAALPKGFPPAGPIGVVILKSYPSYRLAKVEAGALSHGGQDQMFQTLFNHIQKEDIAMTAPVEMGFARPSDTAPTNRPVAHPPTSMGFPYADPMVGKTETDGDVRVVDMPAVTVLSVGVRGSYDHVRFDEGMKAIDVFLDQHPGEYEVTGPPRFLGYNSPFVPWFMRYGEVQLPVNRLGPRSTVP